ncbi:MAG: undecaprenyl/decaprenyl-phosphate alpha-N-acetylglucosaminyl 1-phosphate transferase [Duncaniella sp.]|nr:undecaprenyl/decaprenyl-phosphate alpha-N-acetylglucosaminyl 1-phosphate transferase [Duncaniella sp.]MDE6495902.1 undecaprenyl/decaprenyl-phosphate alpha-N-acetylglucosaminyl 1-phosphate transferase [Duncaniella sp.]
MSYWFWNIGAVFCLCVFSAGILIPQILLIAFRKKLFDVPDARKIHKGAVPRLGGIAFMPVIFFSYALAIVSNLLLGYEALPQAALNEDLMLLCVLCALQLLYLVGMADDLIGIKYRAKFVVQIICAALLIAGGDYFGNLDGILGIYEWPLWIAWPFTAVVIVFLINAINLIDGIDGLASGLSSIACIIYGVAFYSTGDYAFAMLAFATLGVLVPFFYYNVFGNAEKHSKIFMGDTGSLTVGLLLSVLGIKLFSLEPTDTVNIGSPAVLAFSPLIIPCFDVVRVYFHRIRNKKNPFSPDKNHIHHKLLAMGLNQRVAMITIITVSLLLSLMNVAFYSWLHLNLNVIIIVDVALWTIANIMISQKIRKKNNE